MEPFIVHNGKAVCLNRSNIDTDQILPKQFMKKIERTGYADCLFFNWRNVCDGSMDETFELNRPNAQGASILVAGDNFGCGSAREHAVWALRDYGFRVIISTTFPPIFYSNCCNNGILPALVTQKDLQFLAIESAQGATFEVNLLTQSITGTKSIAFEVDRYRKEYLLQGKEDIAVSLDYLDAIRHLELRQKEEMPWLWDGALA